MKRLMMSLSIVLLVIGLAGCGGGGGNASEKDGKITLTVMQSNTGPAFKEVYQQIVKDFEKENPNIKINLQSPGQNYENILKMKMASNELPDLFDTHGWAIKRYGNYLADLSQEDWATDLTESIKSLITDDNGKLYVLPLNESKEGIFYNVDVLKKYNVEVPKTFDELIAASEKIKKESNGEVLPFYASALDAWTIGQYFDYFANPLLISPEHNHADALLKNEFDWSKWSFLPEKYKMMYDKGLLNEDMLTAKQVDENRLFAENKLAFAIHSAGTYSDIKKINPDVKMGVFPIPAIVEGDEPTFVGGEREALGIWKDTKHMDEAKKFLKFMAKKENIKQVSDITNSPAPFKSIQVGGDIADSYEQYKEVRVLPYFDRVYLPNGMWDVMCTLGQELIYGNITPDEFSKKMDEEVNRLISQQKNK
ncbi:extracellular solute-binding protein [Paenibacillus polymyxa]|uniref:ABC transporter substrate-binding protein n=1 Tax=Paenibacillus polymyxa TaxID=1406 RepID=UPI00287FB0BD|nr:extracellular solute-binding protein [Paenibacillus polymyxa]